MAKVAAKEQETRSLAQKVHLRLPRVNLGGLRQFFREVRLELWKVNWPSKEDVVAWTVVVFLLILIVGVYVAILDFIFSKFLKSLGVV